LLQQVDDERVAERQDDDRAKHKDPARTPPRQKQDQGQHNHRGEKQRLALNCGSSQSKRGG